MSDNSPPEAETNTPGKYNLEWPDNSNWFMIHQDDDLSERSLPEK
jgi:hypothetical protein